MRSLRSRLFIAILGTVLLGVGASLALGVVLTKNAVRDTIRLDLERQANAFSAHFSRLPPSGTPSLGAAGPPPEAPPGGGGDGAAGPGPPPGEPRPLEVLDQAAIAKVLPAAAVAELRRVGAANGTAEIGGHSLIFAVRRVGGSYALFTRPDLVSGGDFRRYLSALLIASGVAALVAAAVAALLARGLSRPLRRLALAAGELASGRRPEPVPPEGTEELGELAEAFNQMSAQLTQARDAERAVLLSVSHDLRTPLTSIRGYAEGIEDGTIEPGRAAAVIGRESERLERMVGDLLALARLRQGVLEIKSEEVDLAALAHEAAERLGPRARQLGVRVEVSGDRALARADHGRLLQVVSNLLENAIRVSPAGEAVALAVAPGTITISDRGPGVAPADMPRAFERFYLRARSGADSAQGAGLGLAIVRELTEAMGGQVSVGRAAGGGACFSVRLPEGG